MAKFTKESIRKLREAVDIVEVVSRSVSLKRAGATYKGLCPFHAEKSPSFTVNRSSRHYHCFGCGAHGDAVAFLMQQEGLSFTQAVEFLSERFHVPLEEDRSSRTFSQEKGNDQEAKRARYKQLMESARHFFHACLLFSEQAEEARQYLIGRDLTVSFLQSFHIGYAPESHIGEDSPSRRYFLSQGFSEQELIDVGLMSPSRDGSRIRDFFAGRVTFPVLDHMGSCVGFSARKIREETFGGKYINTPETLLFKKSRTLFGLSYCKKRIVRERVMMLVEGQLDALRLIHTGFDYTVATLGTAFNEGHVDIIRMLGVDTVYLAFDSDAAGVASILKAGALLMKKGVGVVVVRLLDAKDPDEFLLRYGRSQFTKCLLEASDYLEFAVSYLKVSVNWASPHEKDKALRGLISEIKEWDNPILVHESLKKVAQLAHIPTSLLGLDERATSKKIGIEAGQEAQIRFATSYSPFSGKEHVKGAKNKTDWTMDTDTELELDLIRWIAVLGAEMRNIAIAAVSVLSVSDFLTAIGAEMYTAFCRILEEEPNRAIGFLDLAAELDLNEVDELCIAYMVQRPPIRQEKAKQSLYEAIRRIKDRAWIKKREGIRRKMVEEAAQLSEDEQLRLAKEFSLIRPLQLPGIEELFPTEGKLESMR